MTLIGEYVGLYAVETL